VATLSPITVHGVAPNSGAIAAASKPKPRPAPRPRRRAPLRKSPAKKNPPRRAPLRRPRPAVRPSFPRELPVKIVKLVPRLAKKMPVGRVIDLGEWWGNTAYKWLEKMGGGPMRQAPTIRKPDLPFVVGPPRDVTMPVSSFGVLSPQVVTGKLSPTANPFVSPSSAPSYFGAPAPSPSPLAHPEPRPLTRTNRTGVKSAPKPKPKQKVGEVTLTDYGPTPKEELARKRKDRCPKKGPHREICPIRGYRWRAIAWEKVPCNIRSSKNVSNAVRDIGSGRRVK